MSFRTRRLFQAGEEPASHLILPLFHHPPRPVIPTEAARRFFFNFTPVKLSGRAAEEPLFDLSRSLALLINFNSSASISRAASLSLPELRSIHLEQPADNAIVYPEVRRQTHHGEHA